MSLRTNIRNKEMMASVEAYMRVSGYRSAEISFDGNPGYEKVTISLKDDPTNKSKE